MDYHSAEAGGEGRFVAGLHETGLRFQICTSENTRVSVPLERSILRGALIHGPCGGRQAVFSLATMTLPRYIHFQSRAETARQLQAEGEIFQSDRWGYLTDCTK